MQTTALRASYAARGVSGGTFANLRSRAGMVPSVARRARRGQSDKPRWGLSRFANGPARTPETLRESKRRCPQAKSYSSTTFCPVRAPAQPNLYSPDTTARSLALPPQKYASATMKIPAVFFRYQASSEDRCPAGRAHSQKASAAFPKYQE